MSNGERQRLIRTLRRKAKRLLVSERRYLRSLNGKKLLQNALSYSLRWPEMEKVFGRSQSVLEKLFSYHGIRKERPEHYAYSGIVLEIIGDFYGRSKVIKTCSESSILSQEMLAAVNHQRRLEGLRPVTLNAIRCVAQGVGLRWGWPNEKRSTTADLVLSKSKAAIDEDLRWLRSICKD